MSKSPRFTLEDVSKLPKAMQDQIRIQLWEPDKDPYAIPNPTHREAPAPVVEHRDPDPLAQDARTKARHPAKHVVRVTSFRVTLLDEDNLCEKYHVDALRYSGLLPSDAPGECRIITSQEKVSRKEDERTEILIELTTDDKAQPFPAGPV